MTACWYWAPHNARKLGSCWLCLLNGAQTWYGSSTCTWAHSQVVCRPYPPCFDHSEVEHLAVPTCPLPRTGGWGRRGRQHIYTNCGSPPNPGIGWMWTSRSIMTEFIPLAKGQGWSNNSSPKTRLLASKMWKRSSERCRRVYSTQNNPPPQRARYGLTSSHVLAFGWSSLDRGKLGVPDRLQS